MGVFISLIKCLNSTMKRIMNVAIKNSWKWNATYPVGPAMRITRGLGSTLSGTAINFVWSFRSRHKTWRGVSRFPTVLIEGNHVNDRFRKRAELLREVSPSRVKARTPEKPWDDERTPLAAYNEAIVASIENVTTDSFKARNQSMYTAQLAWQNKTKTENRKRGKLESSNKLQALEERKRERLHIGEWS